MCFGKVFFVLFDVLVGYMLYKIFYLCGCCEKRVVFVLLLWLFNLLFFIVLICGNVELVLVFLVFVSVYFVFNKNILMVVFFFVFFVYFKIYFIIYGFLFVLFVGDDIYDCKKLSEGMSDNVKKFLGFVF